MPIREFRCPTCRRRYEVIHPSLDPNTVPPPTCCRVEAELLISLPRIDTSSTFHAFDKPYQGPDGRKWEINNLHDLRKVESEYQKTGHNVRFDAYSGNQSNPDTIDGFGPEYRPPDEERATKPMIDMGATT